MAGPGGTSAIFDPAIPSITLTIAVTAERVTMMGIERAESVPTAPGKISSAVTSTTPTTLADKITVAAIRSIKV